VAEPVPFEQIRKSRLFLELTPTEKAFLECFVGNGGDPCLAIKQAQNVDDEKAQRMLSAARMKNPRISRLIDKIYGDEVIIPSKREFLAHLWKLILRPQEKGEAPKLIQLYADVQGWRKGAGRPSEQEGNDEPLPDSLKDLLPEE
jgi:hypothetical protein